MAKQLRLENLALFSKSPAKHLGDKAPVFETLVAPLLKFSCAETEHLVP